VNNRLIYVTDSDDGGIPTLIPYRVYIGADGHWWIDNYSNLYTAPRDAMITVTTRLNINENPRIEPNGFEEPRVGNGQTPEPATLLLLGAGMIATLVRRSQKH
jgi:hypothetical protein